MDAQVLKTYLINGILIEMLKTGKMHRSVAWIVQGQTTADDRRTGGSVTLQKCWLFYGDTRPNFQMAAGGKPLPSDAISGNTIAGGKRQEVIKYLTDAFSLGEEDATYVVDSAREWLPS